MEFHKWPKIESLEGERLRNSRAFQKAWEIENWVVTEKIDGTNIGLNISKDGWRLSSRNQFVDGGFFGISTALHQIEPLVEPMRRLLGTDFCQITLQGEFFGAKVMNRISYKLSQAFRFFGMYKVNAEFGVYYRMPWRLFVDAMRHAGFEYLVVPVLGHFPHFEDAVAMCREHPSFFNGEARAEGVVIQPVGQPIEPDGLIFKWKREDFAECKLKKVHDPASQDRISALREEFTDYTVVSRMANMFTKMGLPRGKEDAGKYIGAWLNDAWDDFAAAKGEAMPALSAGEVKAVKAVGGLGFKTFVKACADAGIEI